MHVCRDFSYAEKWFLGIGFPAASRDTSKGEAVVRLSFTYDAVAEAARVSRAKAVFESEQTQLPVAP